MGLWLTSRQQTRWIGRFKQLLRSDLTYQWGCRTFQTASHIHVIHILGVGTPYIVVYGHMGPPLPWYPLCRSGVDFGIMGVDLSPCDIVMSWLRLQQASDWIPHPYWMYTKCFRTLICCGWAYGSTLTVLCLCRSGVEFGKIELSPSPSDIVMSWLRLQTHLVSIPHPLSISYV